MNYNFDEIINRKNTNCEKYDGRERIFNNPNVIPLWVADTDFRTPHFITEAIKKRTTHEIYGYPLLPNSFFDSIIGWMKRRHNWQIKKEWINYSPNVVVGLSAAILALTKPGDKIIVQPPVYFPFFNVVQHNGRIMTENPLKNTNGRYHFDLDDLKKKIDKNTKMLLLCNPQNPGGMVWKPDELTALGQICLENNIIIVSDEIHSDLIYSKYKHTNFASISNEFAANSITAMSASKTFNIAGLSSSFLIIPNNNTAANIQRFMESNHLSFGNLFGYIATEAAYKHGEDWTEQLLVYLEKNLNYIKITLSKELPKVKLMQPEATYLAWLDLSELSVSGRKTYDILTKAGVGLSPGFLFGNEGENFIRLNFGCPQSVLKVAIKKIVEALKNL